MTRVWCSDAARRRGDDNIGSASRIDVWILVELPVTWGRNPIHDAVLPPEVRDALKRASADIPRSRLVFIKKRTECLGPTRVYIVRSAPKVSTLTLDLESINEVANVPFAHIVTHHNAQHLECGSASCRSPLPQRQLRLAQSRAAAGAAALQTPLVLVCTHGQHDSCCGRRGYPLFDALRQHDGLDLWQCSHIGGDRFAANAVVLPWGLYYGPVEPRDAQALAGSIAREEILLPSYRGRCTMSRPVQAAETFIRRQTRILGRDALRFVSREALDEEQIRVRFRELSGTVHEATIERYIVHDAARLTCTAMHDDPIPSFRLVKYR
ncbi:MAG TPA: sucrase ferredoxin [Thermoanaerobaculia bacterium]|nr:sucrase ferredoxin [Thermoanaerobaculia bacterium]